SRRRARTTPAHRRRGTGAASGLLQAPTPRVERIAGQAVRDVRDLLRLAPGGLELRELALQRAALGLLVQRHLARERLGSREMRLPVEGERAIPRLRRGCVHELSAQRRTQGTEVHARMGIALRRQAELRLALGDGAQERLRAAGVAEE